MVKVPSVVSFGTIFTAATTSYILVPTGRLAGDTTEANRYTLYREPGTFSNLFVNVSANTITANTTVTLRKNATSDGALTLTIGSSATGIFEDTTHTDASAAGDKWATRLVMGGTGTNITIRTISYLFEATTDTTSRHAVLINTTTATTTTYFALAGTGSTGDATENNVKHDISLGGTFKNLYVRTRTNTKAGNTPVRLRVNGANGTNVITIGSSATGDFEDTTHSDTVSAGDDVNFAYETSVSGSISTNLFSIAYLSTGSIGLLYGSPMAAVTQAETLTRYYHLGGQVDTGIVTETAAQLKTRIPMIISNLKIHVSANTIAGASTFKMRVNSADGFSSITIGSTATGYFTDSANWEECDADDLVCAALVTPTAGGGQVITVRGVSVTTEPFVPTNDVVRAVPTETISIAETSIARLAVKTRTGGTQTVTLSDARTRLAAKNRAIAAQTTTIAAGTAVRIKGKQKTLATETITLSDNRARLGTKLRPIATQSTVLSDSVVRIKTPFGGGPADMSEVAAKTYANKFIVKV